MNSDIFDEAPRHDHEERTMPKADLKQAAHELIDKLPENATWDDVVYEMVTRREIELGLQDSDASRTIPVEDVAKEFGLKA
ncbi:MAG TPA: hypothetical protein VGA00_14170 [Acidiferrobacterales bacterium]